MIEELVEREIAAEQAFVDRVYVQLRGVRPRPPSSWPGRATSRGRLGHEGGLVERDAMVFQAAKRIAQLDAAHEGLVFGRLDLRPELDPEPRYVGRIGLRDEQPRLAAHRLARPRRRGVLPGHRGRAARRRTPPGAALPGAERRRGRGRAARRRALGDRPADRRRGRADGAALPRPRPVDALDRRHHPGRAGQGDPGPRQGRRRRSPAARAPARRSSRCTARRTCSTPTGAATSAAACWSSARAASSCATSSGCCPRSARPRSRCARSARSSTASGRPATTSRRWPTSRAPPGWPS